MQTAETVPVRAQEASVCESAVFTSTSEARLADIGRQALDPQNYIHPLSDSANTRVLTLPAVPAAIAMTLFGFFCVSITRDRRAWLALAGGLIWLGQAGVHTVPELAHRICARAIRQSTAKHPLASGHVIRLQPMGRDELIGYAGLLHRLAALPDRAALFISKIDAKAGAPDLATDGQRLACAITAGSAWQDTANDCPANAPADFVCFSPAFIFSSLSRGPPASS